MKNLEIEKIEKLKIYFLCFLPISLDECECDTSCRINYNIYDQLIFCGINREFCEFGIQEFEKQRFLQKKKIHTYHFRFFWAILKV